MEKIISAVTNPKPEDLQPIDVEKEYGRPKEPKAPSSQKNPAPTGARPPNHLPEFLMIIIALVILAFTAFFALQNYQSKNTTLSPTPAIQATPTPTPDPTANWQTYSNQKYQYSFKYPLNWFLLLPPSPPPQFPNSDSVYQLSNYDSNKIELFMNSGLVDWQSFLGSTPAVKTDISITSQENIIKSSTRETIAKTYIPISQPIAAIGNLPTQIYQTPPGPGQLDHSYAFVAETKETFIHFGVYFSNTNNVDPLATPQWQTLTKILSSFNFQPLPSAAF